MIGMEHKEEPKVKIDFSFTDELGQESRLTKTILKVDSNIQTQLELLVEEFKCFMMSAGFSPETVELIQIVEEE